MERWWSDCGLHIHETRLPGFYVQISTLGSSPSFSSKDDIGNVSNMLQVLCMYCSITPEESYILLRACIICCKYLIDLLK